MTDQYFRPADMPAGSLPQDSADQAGQTEDLEALSYEEAVKELEQTVKKLESADLSLDQSVALFQRGMQLAKICTTRLQDIEKKITQLIEKEDGEVEEKPFGADEHE